MVRQFDLWQRPPMTRRLRYQHRWIFCVAALAVWLAMGWPFIQELMAESVLDRFPVPPLWLLPFTLFGAAVLGSTFLKPRTIVHWALLCAQLIAVVAMTIVHPKDLMSIFLVIIAWQVAMATGPVKALSWVAFQTLAVVGVLLLAPKAYLSYIMALSLVLQLCCVFTAQALRREAETARALSRTNRELRSAQAIIANNVRDAERLRISRELHDVWGHELTALGLQLEIASHVSEPDRANDHVMQAKSLAGTLLARVRAAVANLRETERRDWKDMLQGEHPVSSDDDRVGSASHFGGAPLIARHENRSYWFFCTAVLAVCLALGWPVFQQLLAGGMIRETPLSALWLVPFAMFAAAAFGTMIPKLPKGLRWILLCVQVASVAAMAFIASWAMMSVFLIITAWQVALASTPAKALGWVGFQTLAVVGVLAVAPNPDLCWVVGKSFALQLFFVFAAQALRTETETGRSLARTNGELQSTQAVIANAVRDAERLRISRELHDGWGHELTALGLQLEIATHVTEPSRANDHVIQARGLASGLLGKVRDVVATLREDERFDLKDALKALVQSVPTPAIHVAISPGVWVSPDQAHALIRCAQEAVTNAVKHAQASNLWLQVTSDGEGVRLVARDDGSARLAATSPGFGLLGMRERVEYLGGRLVVQARAGLGFTIDAWLPSRAPQTA